MTAVGVPGVDYSSMSATLTHPNLTTPAAEVQLLVIDETRPNGEIPAGSVSTKEAADEGMINLKPGASPRKGVKGRIRGLKDKYVSCLQAVDGAGDLRGCAASGGGPALAVPVSPTPFDNASAVAS